MNYFIYLLLVCFSISCSSVKNNNSKKVYIKNTIDLVREFETISLSKTVLNVSDLRKISIENLKTNKQELIQLVDVDFDGEIDEVLFQPTVAPLSISEYKITINDKDVVTENIPICYSRFVPERTDDYAWENDKVAFRVYGPTAQKMKESGIKGGTLSSGVDAWLKRVEYSVIDKWYKKYVNGTGSYHKDTGEGLDNFHVGVSRGVGGIAVKNNNEFYFSKNYTKWKTITIGPLRTSFSLEYETWNANGKRIKEHRIISLDRGSNLSKFEIYIDGINEIYAGLTLHQKKGIVQSSAKKGWVSHWESTYFDSELGTAILTDTETYLGQEIYKVSKKDLSNAYAKLKVKNNKVIYYAGFAWKKSNQYPTEKDWVTYLNNFSDKINNPLIISIK